MGLLAMTKEAFRHVIARRATCRPTMKYYKKAIISAPWMEYSGFIAAQLCVLITESRTLEPRTKD